VRAFLGKASPYKEPLEADLTSSILESVPPEARRTARAAGIERLVAQALERSKADEPLSLELVMVRQDLNMRVISLETQLSAMIFEAECTGEMVETIQNELRQKEDRREVRLAVSSLVVGAAAATAAGAWDLLQSDSLGPAITGLSGGLAATGLAAAAFVRRPLETTYHHEHNLLTPIVQGRDDRELYPRFVFRMLILESLDGQPSPRDQLLATWQQLIDETLPPERRAAATALLYGDGGAYDQDTIALRERMYDALETKLNALARDLELLDRFLVRSLEQRIPGRTQ
jgi:hypothetical protein